MPRTVILPGGIIVKNVPDDVTDEEVKEKFLKKEPPKEVEAKQEAVEEKEPHVEEQEVKERPSVRNRKRSNSGGSSVPPEDRLGYHPLEKAVKLARGIGGTVKGFYDEAERIVHGGVIAPLTSAAVGLTSFSKTPEEKAQKLAMITASLNSLFDKNADDTPLYEPDVKTNRVDSEVPKTLAGKIAPYLVVGTKSISAANTLTKGAGLISTIAKTTLGSGITEQLLTNPYDENLFDAIKHLLGPEQQNALLDYFASEEDDSELERRLSLAFQDATLVGAISTIPVFTRLAGTTLGGAHKLLKGPTTAVKDDEAGKMFLRMMKRIKARPRKTLTKANPGAMPNVPVGLDTPANIAEIARVGGEGTKFVGKLTKFLTKGRQIFRSSGYLPQQHFELLNGAVASQRATMQRAENLAIKLDSLIRLQASNLTPEEFLQYGWKAKAGAGWGPTKVAADQIDKVSSLVNLALRGGDEGKVALKSLSKPLQEHVKQARELIDSLTNELVDNPMVTKSLRDTLITNQGEYLRRSYKAFTDPNYVPTTEVFEEAQEELAKRLVKSRAKDYVNITTLDEGRKAAKFILDNLLDKKTVSDFSVFTNRALRINEAVLKRKKDLTPTIRKFLGEELDPAINIVRTVEGMTDIIYKSRWYEQMYKLGNNKWLFPAGRPTGIYNTEIKGTNSLLDGMMTTREMAKVFAGRQAFTGDLLNGSVWRAYGFLKGVSQKAKTVYSHPTHMKNFIGGFGFRAANGYLPFSKNSVKAWEAVKNQITQGGDEAAERLYNEMLDLGIINTNTRIGEFRQLIDEAYSAASNGIEKPNKLTNWILGLQRSSEVIPKETSLWSRVPDKIYQGTDDYFKINTYFDYLDTLKKAYPDSQEGILKRMAADVTRNVIPNYDLVPNAIKELRKAPFSNFAGFNAEVVRTSYNIVKLGIHEIMTGNPVLIERGMNRLVGLTTVTAGGIAAAAKVSQRLVGFDTDEQQAAVAEITDRPYSENPTTFLKRDEEGEIYFLDVSSINPYTYLMKPIENSLHEIMEGKLSEQAVDEMLRDAVWAFSKAALSPFLEESIASKPFLSLGRAFIVDGRGVSGQVIYQPGMSYPDTGMAIAKTIAEAFVPGSLTALDRMVEAELEAPREPLGLPRDRLSELENNLSGMRWQPLRIPETLAFAVGDFISQRNKTLKLAPGYADSPQKILERYRRINKEYYDIQARLYKKADAARALGMDLSEIYSIFEKEGLSGEETRWLLSGMYRPPIDLQDTMFKSFEKVFNEKRRDSRGFSMTWEKLQEELARDNAAMRGVSLETFAEEENQHRDMDSREDAIEILKQGRR